MNLKELLQKYAQEGKGRIQLASKYHGSEDKFAFDGDDAKVDNIKAKGQSDDIKFPEDAIAVFDTVITSTRKDRDGDILRSKGATLVKEMPLLFGHDWDKPIGVMMEVLDHTSKRITARFALADTDLGRDCAKLVRMGALRVSHGFLPGEFEPIEDKSSGTITGFDIKTFEIYETSLVTVPSNVDAEPFAHYMKELETETAKSWVKSMLSKPKAEVESEKHLSYVTPDALPGSYEAKQSMVYKAFGQKVFAERGDDDFYPFPIATFDSKCVMGVHVYGNDGDTVYECSWSEKDGQISIGDLKEVEVEVSITQKSKEQSEGYRKELLKEAAISETTEEPAAEAEAPAEETPAEEPVAEVTEEPTAEAEPEQPEATPEVEAAAAQEPEPEPANTEPQEPQDPILALFE